MTTVQRSPDFYDAANLWLYGNVRLLCAPLACIPRTFGTNHHLPDVLDEIEREAETLVLDGNVLVCGIHNATRQRAAG